MSDADAVIRAEHLRKVYPRGAETVVALNDVTLEIFAGEFVAVVGPSGAGKTTLLQMLGAMDAPTSGRLFLAGAEVTTMSDAERTRLRRDRIGFVFQRFGLLPNLTVAENIALPTLLTRQRDPARLNRLLEKVGLAHRRNHRPFELSGGEMQRVAIARALVNHPPLLLADEPTGNLDTATSAAILALLRDVQREGHTLVIVTHNESLAAAADRVLTLRDGRLIG